MTTDRTQDKPDRSNAAATTNNNKRADNHRWGDRMVRTPTAIRVGFQNINGLPRRRDHPKNHEVSDMHNTYNFDIIGMGEINTNWRKVATKDQLRVRTKEWWQISHNITANLKTNNGSSHQYGGVAMCTAGDMATRIIASGRDQQKLGRWVWTRYQGKRGTTIRIATVYRPNKPTGGPTTVHAQQRQELLKDNIETDPRELFWTDLLHDAKQWRDEGDLLIIGGDFNEDTQSPQVERWFNKIGMVNVFGNGRPVPPTYSGGSKPIDGVFISRTIQVEATGMLGFGEGITSDHRCLWIDIDPRVIGCRKQAETVPARARRLQHRNPRTVQRYLSKWREISNSTNLPGRVCDLYDEVNRNGWSANSARVYEQLDLERIQGMLEAEQRCRKLPMGKVPWTPSVSIARARIRFWKLLQSRKKGRKVSSRMLQRTREAAGIQTGTCSIKEIERELKSAFEEYWTIKRQGHQRRDQWLHQMAEALSENGGSKTTHIKILRTREAQRRTAAAIRSVRNKLVNTTIRKVTPAEGGEPTEERGRVEALILEENARKIKQAWGTPLLTEQTNDIFGRLGDSAASDA